MAPLLSRMRGLAAVSIILIGLLLNSGFSILSAEACDSGEGGRREAAETGEGGGRFNHAEHEASSSRFRNGFSQVEEEFSEELLLRPLVDGKVLAHFQFTHRLPRGNDHHHRLFPKAIDQLVRKFSIREMDLSFTQGRWDYGRWGSSGSVTAAAARPKGLALWAWLSTPASEVDATWRNLTHALSGLFCASINFLEHTATIASPSMLFRPDLDGEGNGEKLVGHGKRVRGSKHADSDGGEVQDGHHWKKSPRHGGASGRQCARTRGERWSGGKLARNEHEIPVRYGALPRESICTENLTPWLKLLPCRDKAGLAALLDRPSIYKGHYHSLQIFVRAEEVEDGVGAMQKSRAIVVEQRLTLVLKPGPLKGGTWGLNGGEEGAFFQPDWSISSLFGRSVGGACPLAKESRVFVEIDEGLQRASLRGGDDGGGAAADLIGLFVGRGDADLADNLAYVVSPRPSVVKDIPRGCGSEEGSFLSSKSSSKDVLEGVEKEEEDDEEDEMGTGEGYYSCAAKGTERRGMDKWSFSVMQYDLKRPDNLVAALRFWPFDLTFRWRKPVVWSPPGSSISVSSFVTGYGNDRGGISTVLHVIGGGRLPLHRADAIRSGGQKGKSSDFECSSTDSGEGSVGHLGEQSLNGEKIFATVFQMVPWYIRLYLHTLSVEVDNHIIPLQKVVDLARFLPAEDRMSPAVVELRLLLPACMKTMSISMEFDKAFLRIDEHPPDASRGLDLPSAVVAFERVVPCVRGRKPRSCKFAAGRDGGETNAEDETSPLLHNLQADTPVHVYTESLLVPLATPDFSMPYNVITLTCTAMAVFFGSMFNALKRRHGEVPKRVSLRTIITNRLAVVRGRMLLVFGRRTWARRADAKVAHANNPVESEAGKGRSLKSLVPIKVFKIYGWGFASDKIRRIPLILAFICFAGYLLLFLERETLQRQ